jgi:hypothetical protein
MLETVRGAERSSGNSLTEATAQRTHPTCQKAATCADVHLKKKRAFSLTCEYTNCFHRRFKQKKKTQSPRAKNHGCTTAGII